MRGEGELEGATGPLIEDAEFEFDDLLLDFGHY